MKFMRLRKWWATLWHRHVWEVKDRGQIIEYWSSVLHPEKEFTKVRPIRRERCYCGKERAFYADTRGTLDLALLEDLKVLAERKVRENQ